MRETFRRRLETPILHESGATDTYAVIDNGVLYTYRTGLPRYRGRSESVVATQNGRVDQPV